MEDEESEIYITGTPTDYSLSVKGNLCAGHPIGRAAYLSPIAVDTILNLHKEKETIRRDFFLGSGNSQIPGGRVLYENSNGELRLSTNIVCRSPPFDDNGSDESIDDIVG